MLLHRPGKELLNLTPNTLEELLFDDIPFLKVAQEEHDGFAQALRDNGVEVVYLEDLTAEVLAADPELREKFLLQWIDEAGIKTERYRKIIFDYMQENYPDAKDFVLKTMEGINLTELHTDKSNSLVDLVSEASKMVVAPMPNLYFTRDPLPVFFGSLCMMMGYLSSNAIFGAMMRTYTPPEQVGLFQGLRIVAQVLVPGVIGPAIGAAVLKNAELVVNGDGTTSFLPNANIWLAAFAAGVVLCGLLALLFARLKKDAPARKTA